MLMIVHLLISFLFLNLLSTFSVNLRFIILQYHTRNGALLRGTGPHEFNGEKYLKVTEYQQAGTQGFVKLPDGMWMLYNQPGPILHPVT